MNDAANDRLDALDQSILDGIRDLYGHVDPCPDGLTDRIKFALTVQALRAEVAELTMRTPAGVRSDVESHTASLAGTITFATPALSVMLSTSEVGDGAVRIDGWVTGGSAYVELHPADGGPVVAEFTDENGRFAFEGVGAGPVWFLVRRNPDDPDEHPVVTPTFTL